MSDQASASESRLDAALSRWTLGVVSWAVARSRAVLIGAALLTVAALVYAALNLGVNSNTKAMLSEDLPFRQMAKQLLVEFPQLGEPLIVVIDADTPDKAREVTAELAEELLTKPELFESVFAPGVGTFFDNHGLLYVDTETLERFSDRIISALPLISSMSRDPTLRGMVGIVDKSLTTTDPGRLTPTRVPQMLDAVAQILEAPLDGRDEGFSWRGWILGQEGEGLGREVILAEPVLAYDDLKAARKPIAAVRDAVDKLGYGADSGVTVRITGNQALGADEMDLVIQQTGVLAVLASLTVVGILLGIGLGSWRLVLATIVTLLAGLSWTTGFAALAIGHLNLVSTSFAVLFIGLGVDFGIHFTLRVRELIRDKGGKEVDPAATLQLAGRDVGGSLALCAATTAIGFFAFVPTRYDGVGELGLISGAGMFLSLAATLTVLPAFLHVTGLPARAFADSTVPERMLGVFGAAAKRPGLAVAAAALATLAASFALPHVRFDPDPVKVRDPGSESVQAMTDLLADSPVPPWTAEILVNSVDDARSLAAQLEALDTVSRVVTLDTFVPEDQDDKLEILDDLSFFLEPAIHDANESPDPTSSDAARATLKHLIATIDSVDVAEEDVGFRDGLSRLRAVCLRLIEEINAAANPDERVRELESSLFGDIPDWLGNLQDALAPEPVTLDVLPEPLLRRYRSDDGKARVEVFPSADVADEGALEDFVTSIQDVAPNTAGAAVEIVESGRAIVLALKQAFTGALAIVTFALMLLWRSLRDTFLVLSSLGLAAVLTAAVTVLLELPFNFADVIVLPLLLGVGVDSGIHLIHRFRSGADAALLETSTARGVLFSALTTIASFGTLAFSTHRGVSSLGVLLSVGLSLTLIANLAFLPALLAYIEAEPPDGGRDPD